MSIKEAHRWNTRVHSSKNRNFVDQIVVNIRRWYGTYLDESISNLMLKNVSEISSNSTIFIFLV